MSIIDFQYAKTPNGALTGKSMIQQTERAISEVATVAVDSANTVKNAQETINTAIVTANNVLSVAETELNEIRAATSLINANVIPAQDAQQGKVLSTNGTALEWATGMRVLGTVSSTSALPSTVYTHGTLVSNPLTDSTLSTLQEIDEGGFNMTVAGSLKEVADLDFTEADTLADCASIINTAISSWGSCAYSETQEAQTTKTILYAWVYNNGESRIYAKDQTLVSTSALYNADGTQYSGTDFTVASDGQGGYAVFHGETVCTYVSSANITITTTETVTVKRFTITTTATGASATISQMGAPTSSLMTDISYATQMALGTVTNGQDVAPLLGDVYWVTALNEYWTWNGTAWSVLTRNVESITNAEIDALFTGS